MAITERELRDVCRRLLRELEVPAPVDPTTLCARLGQARGRGIELVGRALPPGAAWGVLVIYPHKDQILYQTETTVPHQHHIIFHELIYLLRGHLTTQGASPTTVCGALQSAGNGVRGTSLYARWQEWEAETGATILSESAFARSSPPGYAPRTNAERRLDAALGGDAWDWL